MFYWFISLMFSVLFMSALNTSGQYDKVWAFGDSTGINFNVDPPFVFTTSISTGEGCASICDESGGLLFYTDGNTLWSRSHVPMPDGEHLTGTSWNQTRSTSQAAVIIPVLGSNTQYYVFSLSSYQQGYTGSLYYCLVDMTLNGGMGDVVPGTKATVLARDLEEAMTAVPGNQCDIWLLVSSRLAPEMKAFRITGEGIDTVPVVSPKVPGSLFQGLIGTMDVSPDRSKLAFAQGNLVLYDFDATTGTTSNPLILQDSSSFCFYGVTFSPNSTKLYACSNHENQATRTGVFQYNVNLNSTQSIIASVVQLNVGNPYGIRRGADGKLYVCEGFDLSVINQPDLPGLSCGYVFNRISLNAHPALGLPNASTTFKPFVVDSLIVDTAFCADSLLVTATSLSGSNYEWLDGVAGSSRWVHESGTYSLSYQSWNGANCETHIDEFQVVVYPIDKHYTTTAYEGRCQADTFTMIASRLNGVGFEWEDGSTGPSRKINSSGTYWVSYYSDSICAFYRDSFMVKYPEEDYRVSFSADSLVCVGDTIQFQNRSDTHFNGFAWFLGNEDSLVLESPAYHYAQGGTYRVMLIGTIDSICADTAYQTIIVDQPPVPEFGIEPKDVCLGEPVYFYPKLDSTIVELTWNLGEQIRSESDMRNDYQHAFDQAGTLPVTLTIHPRVCLDTSYTDSITVYPLPQVDLGPDSSICLNGQPVYLKNLRTAPLFAYHQVWSTGDTSAVLKVLHPGIYTLTVSTEPLGCTTTETITINKDCYVDIPNAFTPDGDGHNDYFFPRQLLSESLTRFRMQVYNRWGQLVFETSSLNGRGWDGRFNGRVQPMGVYLYRIEADFSNGRQDRYEGNVTLLR